MAYTTIDKPTDYFNTKPYSGDGNSTQAITGVGFKPDWVWIKCRSNAANHNLWDIIRGTSKYLISNSNSAESTDATLFSSFDTDGFTVGNGGIINDSGRTYVAWNWLAGGTASSNTDGSITSSVSANTTAGFSIVSYTGNGTSGATVGHGLGVAPSVVWVKNRSNVDPWTCFYSVLGNGKYIELDASSPAQTPGVAGRWNNTDPNSTVITFGNDDDVNGNTENYVAYCFAEKKGYSKFGSYTGNGSTDGPFIYTGFKPAFVLGKRTDSAGGWWLSDNKRSNGFNLNDEYLIADSSNAEQNDGSFASDFLSNGWKARATNGNFNASGGSYIYMAFAESPFTTSTGIPTTAR